MAYWKEIVCLANSRKYSGRCIAGKETRGATKGAWLRPVSPRGCGEVSEEDRRYGNGQDPRLLDKIQIPLVAHCPHLHQTENHRIDAHQHWVKMGAVPWPELGRYLDHPQSLWFNGPSSYHGLNDRVPAREIAKVQNSLALIAPLDLRLEVRVEGREIKKRKIRAQFKYEKVKYKLTVTDPVVERLYLSKADGVFPVPQAYLCVSVGEEYEGYYYKLVAAVLTRKLLANG